jgi:YhcH/YjgK/YiaL family protein
LHRADLADLPEGWIELENGVRASVQHYCTAAAEELYFETHEKFFDVQFLIEGVERIGIAGREGLTVRAPYDAENDITFYEEPALSGMVALRAGDYVVLAPEDAHKPRCAAGKPIAVKKIVLKVPV